MEGKRCECDSLFFFLRWCRPAVLRERSSKGRMFPSPLTRVHPPQPGRARHLSLPRSGCVQRVQDHAIMEHRCAGQRTSTVSALVGTGATHMAHRIAGRMEWPHAAYSVAPHETRKVRTVHACSPTRRRSSPDAETACEAVVVPQMRSVA